MPNKYPWEKGNAVKAEVQTTSKVKYPWDTQPSETEAPKEVILSPVVKKGKDLDWGGDSSTDPIKSKQKAALTGVTTNRGTPVPFSPDKLAKNSKTAGAFTAGLSDAISLGLIPKALQMVDKESVDKAYQQAEKNNPIAYNVGKGYGYVMGGKKIAGTAPVKSVVSKVGSNLGKQVVEGALVGGGMTAAEDLIKGKDLKTTAKDVAVNTVLGAGADVALHGAGKLVQAIIKKYGKNITPDISKAIEQVTHLEAKADKTPQEMDDYYAMIEYLDEINRKSPEYIKSEARLNIPKAKEIKTLTKTIGEPEKVIQGYVPETKVVGAKDLAPREKGFKNALDSAGTNIDDLVNETKAEIQALEDTQYQYLKNNMKKGVRQGSLIRDSEGIVIGRSGRVSNNDVWYRDLYAELGDKIPSNKDLKQAAIKHLENGFDDIPANDDYIRLKKDLAEYETIKGKLGRTVVGMRPTTKIKPSTLQTVPQTLKPNKPILSALDAKINKPYDAPKPPLQRIEPPQIKQNSIGSINTPIAEKPLKTNLKSSTEQNLIKLHDTVSNLEYAKAQGKQIDEELLSASKKQINEYNKVRRTDLQTKANNLVANSDTWTDKGMMALERERWDRNIIDIAGEKDGGRIKKEVFDPIRTHEAESIRFKNQGRNTIKALNLSKKESEIVQMVGEGKMAITDIPKGIDPAKIQKSVETFRKWYDEALTKANETLARNKYKPIPKLDNYFPHFEGDDPVLRALGIRLDMVDLPTDINGLTHQFKPGKNFFGNALKRTGDKTTFDAVQGFDRYIEGISKVIHHTDDIQNLRSLNRAIRLKYSPAEISEQVERIIKSDLPQEVKDSAIDDLIGRDKTHLSNAVADLEEYTNVLAGKKDLADRAMERKMGRVAYNVANFLENRIGKNMVALNPASWLTNFIPLTQSAATTGKKEFVQAMGDTLKSLITKDGFIDRSTFLTNRVGSDLIDKTVVDKAGDVLTAPFKWIDTFTSQVVTRAKYLEGLKKGLKPDEAMVKADDFASKLIGDRSLGAQPTLFNQRDPLTRLFTQFQLEVNNQISFITKDIPREFTNSETGKRQVAKIASAVGQLALYGWLYNQAYESVTGRRPALDPIGIALNLKEGLEKGKKSDAILKAAGQTIQQLPFTGVVGGGRLPISAGIPDIKKLGEIGIKSATGEMTQADALKGTAKEFTKPLYYLTPPFGGGQAKKTIEGIGAFKKGGSYNGDKLRFPIEKTSGNAIKTAVFGQYSTKEGKDYFKSNNRELSEKQTEKLQKLVKAGKDPQKEYNKILIGRKIDGLKADLTKLKNNTTLTAEERAKRIKALTDKINELKKQEW